MSSRIFEAIQESVNVKQQLLEEAELLEQIQKAADLTVECLQGDGKVLFCGNGGSAADAQHLAGELSGRFYFDRPPLYAEALHVNTAYLTAVANDYGYEEVYSRMVHAAGRKGDVLFALSTSGNSPNVLKAISAAQEIGMSVIGMTGKAGGKMAGQCHIHLNIPSNDTPRIQECHMLIGHIICELVEHTIFG
jgi:D-sedoheptulose 7-phosphate isomerase